MQKFEITNAEGGTAFLVQVTVHAESNKIAGKDSDVVFIDLATDPDNSTINTRLEQFLATKLRIPAQQITIASGNSIEKKIVIIMGLTPVEIEHRLFS